MERRVRAVCAVRDIDGVRVYSPTADQGGGEATTSERRSREHRETFAERMPEKLDTAVEARDDPESVVRGADVVYCATDSETPVLEADWLAPGTHVHTVGPKTSGAHELPPEAIDRADVVTTDSIDQVAAYDDGGGFVIDDWDDRLVELGDLVVEGVDRDPDALTVFCSVGLAGTEVLLADRYLRDVARQEG